MQVDSSNNSYLLVSCVNNENWDGLVAQMICGKSLQICKFSAGISKSVVYDTSRA